MQDDLVDSSTADVDNFTLFYWIEAAPKGSATSNQLLARYIMLYGAHGHLSSSYLSVAGGERRYFGRNAIGHYGKGGFFWWGSRLRFLAQSSESDGIKGNVVSIKL